jgi:hypothetical protein
MNSIHHLYILFFFFIYYLRLLILDFLPIYSAFSALFWILAPALWQLQVASFSGSEVGQPSNSYPVVTREATDLQRDNLSSRIIRPRPKHACLFLNSSARADNQGRVSVFGRKDSRFQHGLCVFQHGLRRFST